MRYAIQKKNSSRRQGLIYLNLCNGDIKLTLRIPNSKYDDMKEQFNEISALLSKYYDLYDLKQMNLKGSKKLGTVRKKRYLVSDFSTKTEGDNGNTNQERS